MGETGKPQLVIFTDLDGTLLDLKTYSYLPALEALGRIIRGGVPLVFCSSKTRVEQQFYRERIGILEPMIVENGGAILIPQDYFAQRHPSRQTAEGYKVIELGVSADRIRSELEKVRNQTQAHFRGFSEVSLEELCRLTDLDAEAGMRAQNREYSETIISEMSGAEMRDFLDALRARDLSCSRGSRFHTVVSSKVDKGRAVKLLTDLFRNELGDVRTAGIGDSANDAAMLAAVDVPFLLQRPDGTWEQNIRPAHLKRVKGSGPEAWNRLVCHLLNESSEQ